MSQAIGRRLTRAAHVGDRACGRAGYDNNAPYDQENSTYCMSFISRQIDNNVLRLFFSFSHIHSYRQLQQA